MSFWGICSHITVYCCITGPSHKVERKLFHVPCWAANPQCWHSGRCTTRSHPQTPLSRQTPPHLKQNRWGKPWGYTAITCIYNVFVFKLISQARLLKCTHGRDWGQINRPLWFTILSTLCLHITYLSTCHLLQQQRQNILTSRPSQTFVVPLSFMKMLFSKQFVCSKLCRAKTYQSKNVSTPLSVNPPKMQRLH